MPRSFHSPEQQRLIQLLREAREQAGLRQVDLAERLAKPQSFVSKYEAGQRRLDYIEVHAICGALGMSFTGLARKFDRPAAR